MTLQKRIYEHSECETKREFGIKTNRSESYTANMLNSDVDISMELGIKLMKTLHFDNEVIIEIINLHLLKIL